MGKAGEIYHPLHVRGAENGVPRGGQQYQHRKPCQHRQQRALDRAAFPGESVIGRAGHAWLLADHQLNIPDDLLADLGIDLHDGHGDVVGAVGVRAGDAEDKEVGAGHRGGADIAVDIAGAQLLADQLPHHVGIEQIGEGGHGLVCRGVVIIIAVAENVGIVGGADADGENGLRAVHGRIAPPDAQKHQSAAKQGQKQQQPPEPEQIGHKIVPQHAQVDHILLFLVFFFFFHV